MTTLITLPLVVVPHPEALANGFRALFGDRGSYQLHIFYVHCLAFLAVIPAIYAC